jgi:hypothetical protein
MSGNSIPAPSIELFGYPKYWAEKQRREAAMYGVADPETDKIVVQEYRRYRRPHPSRVSRTIIIDAYLKQWVTPLILVNNGDVYEPEHTLRRPGCQSKKGLDQHKQLITKAKQAKLA